MIIYLSLLIALVGVLMYALATNGKVVAIGMAMFECGLLAFLLCFCTGGHLVSIVPR